jgi:hypothetical protein
MTTDSDWPTLLANYKVIVDRFEVISRGLVAALDKPGEANGQLAALLAAEAGAREAVVLARTRLMNLWRETQVEQLSPTSTSETTQHDTRSLN